MLEEELISLGQGHLLEDLVNFSQKEEENFLSWLSSFPAQIAYLQQEALLNPRKSTPFETLGGDELSKRGGHLFRRKGDFPLSRYPFSRRRVHKTAKLSSKRMLSYLCCEK